MTPDVARSLQEFTDTLVHAYTYMMYAVAAAAACVVIGLAIAAWCDRR